jgi:hypothetical protein
MRENLEKQAKDIEDRKGKLADSVSAANAEGEAIKVASSQRRDAFFQARSSLLKEKGPWYWEQFEGLYALMRGLCFSLGTSAFYLFGWSSVLGKREWSGAYGESPLFVGGVGGVAVVCLLVILIASYRTSAHFPSELRKKTRNLLLIALLFLFLACGVIGASHAAPVAEIKRPGGVSFITIVTVLPEGSSHSETGKLPIRYPALAIGFLALLAAVMSVRCYGAYKTFADLFAENVWRDFANIEAIWTQPEGKWSPQSQEFLSSPPQES